MHWEAVMKLTASISALLLGCALALPVAAAANVTDPDLSRSLPAQGPVSVSWTDPAQFTELRSSGNRWEAQRGDWVRQLAEYLRQRAERRLAPGEQLQVTFTDIRRAGDFEPWRGPRMDDVRIMRDIYPPRINLSFSYQMADGSTRQGERQLTDLGYLSRTGRLSDTDALRYEKRLIDDWIAQDIARALP
jgi:hypothetical protein